MAISRGKKNGNSPPSMFSAAAPRARDSALQEKEAAWLTRVLNWSGTSLKLLAESALDGCCGKTSPACCQATKDEISAPCSEGWASAGMGSPTAFLTLNISEWPSAAAVCSLSDILETGVLPPRYFLSAKACQGILRRAEKRGKELPATLQAALEAVAREPAE